MTIDTYYFPSLDRGTDSHICLSTIGTHGPKGFHVYKNTYSIELWNLARGLKVISSLLCRHRRDIGIPFFDLDDTYFSLSQLFVVPIEELLDVFGIIGFVKKAEKKGSQFTRFKFKIFINQNSLVKLVEHSVCIYKRNKEHLI